MKVEAAADASVKLRAINLLEEIVRWAIGESRALPKGHKHQQRLIELMAGHADVLGRLAGEGVSEPAELAELVAEPLRIEPVRRKWHLVPIKESTTEAAVEKLDELVNAWISMGWELHEIIADPRNGFFLLVLWAPSDSAHSPGEAASESDAERDEWIRRLVVEIVNKVAEALRPVGLHQHHRDRMFDPLVDLVRGALERETIVVDVEHLAEELLRSAYKHGVSGDTCTRVRESWNEIIKRHLSAPPWTCRGS